MTVLLPLPAASTAWAPSVSFAIGWEGDDLVHELDSSDSFSSSAFAEARINVISVRIAERHRVSVPFILSAVSAAALTARTEKGRETGYGLEAEYGIYLQDGITISIGGGFRAHRYEDAEAWYISYGGTLTPEVRLMENLSLIAQASFYGGQNGWYSRFGLGMKMGWGMR